MQVNIDWAGIALERTCGKRLNDYIQTNICQPLGLANLTMIPTPEMKENLARMHQRSGGRLSERDHLLKRPIIAQTPQEREAIFHSGGAGMFARPQEYARKYYQLDGGHNQLLIALLP